jgi:hypothetical protein
MVWDLARASGKLNKPRLTDMELETLWSNLAGDAIRAEDAIEALVQFPGQAVPFLKDRLKPLAAPDAKLLERLITDLASDDDDVREKAMTELGAKIELAEAALRKTLEAGKPPAGTRRAISDLLSRPLPAPNAETLRGLRAIETLEKISTKEAAAVIERITHGAAGARLTQDASATMQRLARRN